MHTHELLELYSQYYQDPERTWTQLFDGLKNYSFKDYDVFLSEMSKLVPQCKVPVTLEWQKSNLQTKYLFGPASIKIDVEYFLRFFSTTKKAILIQEDLRSENTCPIVDAGDLTILYISDIWLNWQKVESFIKHKTKEWDKCFVYGPSYCLNQMTSNEEFLESMKDIIDGFVNTDIPAFCKTIFLQKYNMHFNDQMINWKTGLNFYTCVAGYKHFLPIFLQENDKCHNLINIINRKCGIKISDDDVFEQTGPFKTCLCGKPRCEFKLLPHSNNFLTDQNYEELMEMRNVLTSRYRWIQFIEKDSNMSVLYQTSQSEMTNEDKNLILSKFPKIVFKSGENYKVGVKYPCFWKLT